MILGTHIDADHRSVAFYQLPEGYPNTDAFGDMVKILQDDKAVPDDHVERGTYLGNRKSYLRKSWLRHSVEPGFDTSRAYLLVSNFGVSDVFRFTGKTARAAKKSKGLTRARNERESNMRKETAKAQSDIADLQAKVDALMAAQDGEAAAELYFKNRKI